MPDFCWFWKKGKISKFGFNIIHAHSILVFMPCLVKISEGKWPKHRRVHWMKNWVLVSQWSDSSKNSTYHSFQTCLYLLPSAKFRPNKSSFQTDMDIGHTIICHTNLQTVRKIFIRHSTTNPISNTTKQGKMTVNVDLNIHCVKCLWIFKYLFWHRTTVNKQANFNIIWICVPVQLFHHTKTQNLSKCK